MFVSQLAPAYEKVQDFLAKLETNFLADVRAMLLLPSGCNFTIASTLCNVLSGISVTIYKLPRLLQEFGPSECSSRNAFCGLVDDFFPKPQGAGNEFSRQLYSLCRNPLVHCVGLLDPTQPVVELSRFCGFDDAALKALESNEKTPESWFWRPGIKIHPSRAWTIKCDGFYEDVINLLRGLTADHAQMRAAENRLSNGVYIWRVDPRRSRRRGNQG